MGYLIKISSACEPSVIFLSQKLWGRSVDRNSVATSVFEVSKTHSDSLLRRVQSVFCLSGRVPVGLIIDLVYIVKP